MNKLIYFLLFLFLLASCEGMNDNIEEYLNRGEINYIGKPDSSGTVCGKERIQIFWKVNDDPRIEHCRIFWNSKQDSIVVPIDRNKLDENNFASVIFNIPEGSYIFDIYHTGSKGYRSIREEATGNSYGDIYQSTLVPRKITRMSISDGRIQLDWGNPEEGLSKSVVVYQSLSGQVATIEVLRSQYQTVLTDGLPGSKFTIVSYYLPETNTLDEFNVASPEMTFPSLP